MFIPRPNTSRPVGYAKSRDAQSRYRRDVSLMLRIMNPVKFGDFLLQGHCVDNLSRAGIEIVRLRLSPGYGGSRQ